MIEKRGIALYVVSLAVTLITNYYIGFMVCIFSGIYFFYKLFGEKFENRKVFFEKISRFFIFSLIAVIISSVILLPVFFGLKDGRGDFSANNFTFNAEFSFSDFFSKFFSGSFVPRDLGNTGLPPVFCGVIIYLRFNVIFYE